MVREAVISSAKAESVNERVLTDNLHGQSVDFEKIADKIYYVETHNGKDLSGRHGKCVAQGKANGYSYAPGTCYENDHKVREIVIDWLKRKTQSMTLNEALNLYGCGKQDCSYAEVINKINI